MFWKQIETRRILCYLQVYGFNVAEKNGEKDTWEHLYYGNPIYLKEKNSAFQSNYMVHPMHGKSQVG